MIWLFAWLYFGAFSAWMVVENFESRLWTVPVIILLGPLFFIYTLTISIKNLVRRKRNGQA